MENESGKNEIIRKILEMFYTGEFETNTDKNENTTER